MQDHPNIVKAYEVYDYKKQIYIAMELCDGDDLYTRAPYSEKGSALIVGKLLSAIKYMHDHGCVHRDLKFENIMFENNSPNAQIKVIDFGLSKKFLAGQTDRMTEGVGTIYTMAPQVLQGVYTSQADLWSVGVIAFMLLSSHRPFYSKQRRVMIDQIMRADYNLQGPGWGEISEEAKDFVSNLMVLDPKTRLNATSALVHKWLSVEFKPSDRKPTDAVLLAVDEGLVHYKDTSQLKKIALNVIAHRSSTEEILELRKCFDHFDSANDGIVSFEEFRLALQKANYSEETLKEIFESIVSQMDSVV
jgi:calcium-dependent protein kinase